MPKSVSYTHLDVYKRQTIFCAIINVGLTIDESDAAVLLWSKKLQINYKRKAGINVERIEIKFIMQLFAAVVNKI